MNNYQFLVSEREQGRYDEYLRRGLISLNLERWMDVYQYHIDHPDASTWLVANSMEISQKHVRNIYAYMDAGEKLGVLICTRPDPGKAVILQRLSQRKDAKTYLETAKGLCDSHVQGVATRILAQAQNFQKNGKAN